MTTARRAAGARLRVVLTQDVALGPGKADLLEGIRDTGSIAAAGRRLGMSYKRAWLLVLTLNRGFREPLVDAVKWPAPLEVVLPEVWLCAKWRMRDGEEAAHRRGDRQQAAAG